jgi:hypothetical protein
MTVGIGLRSVATSKGTSDLPYFVSEAQGLLRTQLWSSDQGQWSEYAMRVGSMYPVN